MDWLTWLGLSLMIVFWLWLASFSLGKESQQVMAARKNCDPEPLLSFSREVRARQNPKRRSMRSGWFVHTLNEMVALCDLGRLEEAQAVLSQVEPWLQLVPEPQRDLYQMNRCALLLMRHQAQDALPYLRQCDESSVQRPKDVNVDSFAFTLALHHWFYRFLTEAPSEALLAQALSFVQQAEAMPLNLQIICKSYAAQCFLALGREADALPYLHFVAEQGGKFHHRAWAREQLRRLHTGEAFSSL